MVLMIVGTMSNVGKSLIAAGLCRVFAQDGYRVAPFKSQNMSNNSYVTADGLEMGRAQVVQAECCGIMPDACMNPILLKPVTNCGSQVVVMGRSIGNMSASEYFEYKTKLIPVIKEAFDSLNRKYDIVVIEGAGSPAEINLKENDIVNMGLAEMTDAQVLLVGDIDRGGVFAQLLGTLDLLEDSERKRIKGLLINKFRGDETLLAPGIRMLEERAKCPVVGTIPYADIHIDDEDSLTERFNVRERKTVDIAVVRLPHISNHTDLDVFDQADEVSVRFISEPAQIGTADIIVIPGTKNTIEDMGWLMGSGFSGRIKEEASRGTVIIGICGGYQMLGESISDPENSESGGNIKGLGLLPVRTVMAGEKTVTLYDGELSEPTGVLSGAKGCRIKGYEIHMGMTTALSELSEFTSKSGYCIGNVYGTYVHGIFDSRDMARSLIGSVAQRAGKEVDVSTIIGQDEYKQQQYDRLADLIRGSLDMDRIYGIMGNDGKGTV